MFIVSTSERIHLTRKMFFGCFDAFMNMCDHFHIEKVICTGAIEVNVVVFGTHLGRSRISRESRLLDLIHGFIKSA